MAKLSSGIAAAAFAAVLILAGCSGPPSSPEQVAEEPALPWYPPWTLNQSSERIALRWYPDATPLAAAAQVARSHCGSWNKSAELASDTRDGSAEIAEYHCR